MQGAPFYVNNGTADRPQMECKQALDFGTPARQTGAGAPRSFVVGGQTMALVAVEVTTAEGALSGWMQPAHLAGGGVEPAAVIDDVVVLMKGPSINSGVLARLHRMDLVAAVRGGNADYIPAVAVDPQQKVPYPQAYIEAKSLSFSPKDVAAAVLVARSDAARTTEEAKSFLESALQSFPTTVFMDDIRQRLGNPWPAERATTEPLATTLTVLNNGAPIRSTPSEDGEVVATLKADDEVTTISRTLQIGIINGVTAHWYEISGPVHGWVFGLDLQGAD